MMLFFTKSDSTEKPKSSLKMRDMFKREWGEWQNKRIGGCECVKALVVIEAMLLEISR